MLSYRMLVCFVAYDYRRAVGQNHEHGHGDGHSHSHGHHHLPKDNSDRSFAIAFFANLSFAAIEIVGGFLTNSLAITADAVHDLGDALSIGFAWGLERFSKKESDPSFNFGYRRFSLVAALLSGIVISLGAIGIAIAAISRFSQPRNPMTLGMGALAILGILVNGFAALALQRGGKSHNEKMLTWHLLEDLYGWVIVLIGTIVMHFTGWTWIDPLLAILLTVFILWNVLRSLKETLFLLLQGKPSGFHSAKFSSEVIALESVAAVDTVRVWSLDGVQNVLSLRIHVHSLQDHLKIEHIKRQIREIASRHTVLPQHVTIETCLAGDACGPLKPPAGLK